MYICPSAPPNRGDPLVLQPSHYSGVSGAARNNQRIDLEDTSCGDHLHQRNVLSQKQDDASPKLKMARPIPWRLASGRISFVIGWSVRPGWERRRC